MGDKINNMKILKKLNIDATNQWIFYDDRFQNFFDFLTNNVTEENLLTEEEVLEYDELISRNKIYESDEKNAILRDLDTTYPGLLTVTSVEINKLQQNISIKERMLNDYEELVTEMRKTKSELDEHVHSLEDTCEALEKCENKTYSFCLDKAVKLEKLQDYNYKKFTDVNQLFSKAQLSPLFMHQMPLDQFFLKCDSFLEYISLYLKKQFIIHYEGPDHRVNNSLVEEAEHLERLESLICCHQIGYITELAKVHGIKHCINGLNLGKIDVLNLTKLKRGTHELAMINHSEEIAYNELMADVKRHIRQIAGQTVELILLKNTKSKLERATEQYNKAILLSDIVFKVLSCAELIWIAIQIDTERIDKHLGNTEHLLTYRRESLKRTQMMQQKFSITSNCNGTNLMNHVLNQFSGLLSQHLNQHVLCDQKSCLREYKKFKLLLQYSEQNLIHHKHCTSIWEGLNHMDNLELILRAIVYDGPLAVPSIDNVRHLRPVFDAKVQQEHFNEQFRNLREQFSKNISERMKKDPLWRSQQMLWIWFLTEPNKILNAIEEVKKAASKAPQIKSLGGIIRKEK